MPYIKNISRSIFIILGLFVFSSNTYAAVGDGSIDSTVAINGSTTNGPTLSDGDYYGDYIANMGDLNGDGVTDLAVGARYDDAGGTDRGAVHIHFMNTDGSIDSTVEINSNSTNGPSLANSDQYGISVANMGDLNGDGVTDLAVGAHADDTGGTNRGAVHIHFMNTDGSVKSTVEINDNTLNGPTLANGDLYGVSVANIGDLDGDGVQDIAVGAHFDDAGGTDRGAVHIHFMNTDGSVDSTVEINSTTTNGPTLADFDHYGVSVANIGDLDGDGVTDLAVGAFFDDTGGTNRGAVHIHFMNTDGSVDSTVEINSTTTNGPTLADNDWYSISVANIGDLDGDGVQDLAAGAVYDDAGGTDRGAINIHFMNTDGSIDSTVEINDNTPNGPVLGDSYSYGDWITNIGDLDSNGVQDIAVGAAVDDTGGTDRGALYIHFMAAADITIENPTPTDINNAVTNGSITIDNGSITNTSQVTTQANITFTSTSTQALFPSNTVITKQGGGNYNFQNFTISDTTVTNTYAAVEIGTPGTDLSFSQDITLTLNVGSAYNGQTLNVYSQSTGQTDWTNETTCTVSDGNCTFTTNHATVYTAGGIPGATPIEINVEVQDTLTLDCYETTSGSGNYDVSLGTTTAPGFVTAGTPAVGTSTCTATTNDDQGYYLSIEDDNSSTYTTLTHTDPNTATVYEIQDLTQYTESTPNTQTWNAPTTKGLGFSVITFPDTTPTNNTLGTTWTNTSQCPQGSNPDTNDYAGIPDTPQAIAAVPEYSANQTTTNICYKVDVPASQPSGIYTGSVTYTATSDASSYIN